MIDVPRTTIIGLVLRFGSELGNDPQRCQALLRDLCGSYKKEITALTSVIHSGIINELHDPKGTSPEKLLIERCASRLHDDTGIVLELARWAVESWAIAFHSARPGRNKYLFRCPSCGTFAHNENPTAERCVSCPKCNARVHVSKNDLDFSLISTSNSASEFFCQEADKTDRRYSNAFLDESPLRPKMILIQPASFAMGSPESDKDAKREEKPQHPVTLTRSYCLSETVITQVQWKSIMKSEPWKGQDYTCEGDAYPATYLSWEDALEYCSRLSELEGRLYRLPTEAEWEYACRGGTKTRYNFGDSALELSNYGWFAENTIKFGEAFTHKVKQKLPNSFGLYDMHGNHFEWCSDWLGAFKREHTPDPSGPLNGSYRIVRGGSWVDQASGCRTAVRGGFPSSYRNADVGIRLALDTTDKVECD
jgi:formylglycine-generating enzyme required for sulfatase activity